MNQTKMVLFACLFPAAALAAPENFAIDPIHSFVTFTVGHLGMSSIAGRFDRLSGKFVLDRVAKTGEVEVDIDAASINTGDAKHEAGSWAAKNYGPRSRDEHLRTADFFNVAEFPQVHFKSTKLNFNGDMLEGIDGTLTLLGVSKPVKLTVTSYRCAPNPFTKKDMCGADAVAQIKRSAFGMKTFVGPVSDEVKLAFNVEAYKE